MPGTSVQPSWRIWAGLVFVFVTLYYIDPFDGARRVLGPVFLLTVLLTRWFVVRGAKTSADPDVLARNDRTGSG